LLVVHSTPPSGPSEYVIVTISATFIQVYKDTIVTDPFWTGSGSKTMRNDKLFVYESLKLSNQLARHLQGQHLRALEHDPGGNASFEDALGLHRTVIDRFCMTQVR
jgi:hypothetical protein